MKEPVQTNLGKCSFLLAAFYCSIIRTKQNSMQGWHYGKGLIYYRSIFRLTKLAFLSISLIRDPARATSQLYLRVAWTSAFKQFFFPSEHYHAKIKGQHNTGCTFFIALSCNATRQNIILRIKKFGTIFSALFLLRPGSLVPVKANIQGRPRWVVEYQNTRNKPSNIPKIILKMA